MRVLHSMTELGGCAVDEQLERLKSSRSNPAVLKLRLANLRAAQPDVTILVFEGDDDKIVYGKWIRQLRPDLRYEPLPCRGKKQVLRLKDAAVRDKSDIIKGVYFFVDRDFDDLAGHDDHDQLFMSEFYAVENYLVNSDVLSELLKNEFHCDGEVELRKEICSAFSARYAEFLSETEALNRKIFVARRAKIAIDGSLPDKLNAIAKVSLKEIESVTPRPELSFNLQDAPSAKVLSDLTEEFGQLDPPTRYRGKFALMFFKRWLSELSADYKTAGSMFGGLVRTSNVRDQELVLSNFASISNPPPILKDFLASVK